MNCPKRQRGTENLAEDETQQNDGPEIPGREDLSPKRVQERDQQLTQIHMGIGDIYNMVDTRMSRMERSMDHLADTTNHRLERYEAWLSQVDERINTWMKAMEALIATKADKTDLAKKADKNQLLTSVAFRWLNIGYIRWALGALAIAVFTTAASQHWFIHVANWLEHLVT